MNHVSHPSVTDPVKLDPVKPDSEDFLPSSSENLASSVPGEIFSFTRPICGFPGATFTYPAYIIYVFEKRKNSDLTEKGNLVDVSSENPIRI